MERSSAGGFGWWGLSCSASKERSANGLKLPTGRAPATIGGACVSGNCKKSVFCCREDNFRQTLGPTKLKQEVVV